MTMKHAWLLLVAAGLLGSGLVRAVNVDFSKDGADALFEAPDGTLPEVVGGVVTLPSRADTRVFPVVSGKKYKLEISAETEGDFVTEKNDRAHILTLQSPRSQVSSTYEVVFQNAAGEEVRGFGGSAPGATPLQRGFFLTNQRQPYVFVFYAPPGATGARVRFLSNGRSTRIAGLRLAEESDEGTVNPNPDFRYGELNYSGWQPARDGRLYTRPDGKTVMNLGYGGGSPFFPFHAETTYQVFARGGGAKPLDIEYFDKDGKPIVRRFLIRLSEKGEETKVTPPAGTVMARVTALGALIEEFAVRVAK